MHSRLTKWRKKDFRTSNEFKNVNSIDSNDMLIDSDHLIHSILDLIRGRVQVKINVRSRNVHIPLGPYVCQSADYFWLELHSN